MSLTECHRKRCHDQYLTTAIPLQAGILFPSHIKDINHEHNTSGL